jgi:hypothetical protein
MVSGGSCRVMLRIRHEESQVEIVSEMGLSPVLSISCLHIQPEFEGLNGPILKVPKVCVRCPQVSKG